MNTVAPFLMFNDQLEAGIPRVPVGFLGMLTTP